MARILVADDDESVRAAVRHVLVAAGHTVDEAADGQTALERYRDTPSDLVLIDLYMPRMDGLEAILRLKAVQPGVKIVAMSGGGFRDKHDVLTMARKAGACLTLAKPFEFEDLLAAVSNALGPAGVGPEVDAGQIAEVKGLPGALSGGFARAGFRALPKPFTTEQLLDAIAAVVPKGRAPGPPGARWWHVFKFLRRKRRP